MTRFNIRIGAVYNTQPAQPMFMVVGPLLQTDTPPEALRTIVAGLVEEALLRLSEVTSQSLPSLPERNDNSQLAIARQWFNLVESGKQGARVSVWENEKGRYILIHTDKPEAKP
jgi:hypothetical protein